jgi:hypothetical protein
MTAREKESEAKDLQLKDTSTCAEHTGMCEKILNIKDDTSEMKEMIKKWDTRFWALMVSLLLVFLGWTYTANQQATQVILDKAKTAITQPVSAQDTIKVTR